MLNVADGASLLARLEFEHVCVGKDRWQRLLPTVLTHIDDHLWTFNDAHFSLVLNALKLSRSTETAENQSKDLPFDEKHLNSIRNFCNSIRFLIASKILRIIIMSVFFLPVTNPKTIAFSRAPLIKLKITKLNPYYSKVLWPWKIKLRNYFN